MNHKNLSTLFVVSSLLVSTSVLAQPVDPYQPPEPSPAAEPAAQPAAEPAASSGPSDEERAQSEAEERMYLEQKLADLEARSGVTQTWQDPTELRSPKAKVAAPVFPAMRAPQLLSVPTAHLLPAAVVYSTASVDTGGSIGGSLRVGLGDVGEFGLETSPLIRMVPTPGKTTETIQPLLFATFKMGVAEGRLFDSQPALALGFRKSFAREFHGNDLRAAAIEMTASKSFGNVSVHGGGVFWDAQLEEIGGATSAFHELDVDRQIRPFGGIEAEPIKNAQLLIDLAWVPLFRPGEEAKADRLALRPALSWGIRYVLSNRVSLESGVRVPDIGEANLLDAQIFGQFTFASDRIRRSLGISQ